MLLLWTSMLANVYKICDIYGSSCCALPSLNACCSVTGLPGEYEVCLHDALGNCRESFFSLNATLAKGKYGVKESRFGINFCPFILKKDDKKNIYSFDGGVLITDRYLPFMGNITEIIQSSRSLTE